jgi:negative regulator of genetic competence, sporulation and motility
MVIIKISNKTVQCSIAAQELQEIGLTPQDLVQGDEKSVQFMAQLNQEVGQQLDYDPENEVMMMSRNMMSDGSVRIYAVKMNNDDIQQSADRLKTVARGILDYLSQDRIDQVLKAKGQDKSQALNEMMDGMNQMVSQIYLEQSQQEAQKLLEVSGGANGNPAEPTVTSRPALDYQRYLGEFSSLDDVIRFARVVSSIPVVDSALYKGENTYYLMMGVRTTSDSVVYELRKMGIEYANSLTVNSPEELHLEETGDCVIAKDAVAHLMEMA